MTATTTLEIDVQSRWDAVQLLERLAPYHPHLVQLDFPEGRWLVRAQTPGTHGETVTSAVDAIEEWHRERGIASVGVFLTGVRPLMEAELRRALRKRHRRVAES